MVNYLLSICLHQTSLNRIHTNLCSWPHNKATSQQKINDYCILDLSAAFDTTDYYILVHRLSSWFDLNGAILFWLQSLSLFTQFRCQFRCFVCFSFLIPAPELSYLWLICTHHLYADDTQLLISVFAPDFSQNISRLETSDVGEAVFVRPRTRPSQHWPWLTRPRRGSWESASDRGEAVARQSENHVNVLN